MRAAFAFTAIAAAVSFAGPSLAAPSFLPILAWPALPALSPPQILSKYGRCLSDSQAAAIAEGFRSILTNPNRQGANATAQQLISPSYNETSDSINKLAGFPLGSVTFAGKTAFINGVITAQAIPSMTTLMTFHDCTHVAWYWLVQGLGLGTDEVRGINLFTVDVDANQIVDDRIEFNSASWGVDTGYMFIFPGQPCS